MAVKKTRAYHSKSWLAITFVIAGFFLTLTLWQFYRLSWKENLIQERAHIQTLTPKPFLGETPHYDGEPTLLEGHFLSPFIYIYKAREGKTGFDHYRLLKTQGGHIIALLIGFSEEKQTTAPLTQRFKAHLRIYQKPKTWVENTENSMVYLDLNALAAHYNVPLTQKFYAVMKNPPQNFMEVPLPKLPNNHLMYALTWLTLFVLTLFTGLKLYRKKVS